MRVSPEILAAARQDLSELVSIPSVSARAEALDACAAKVELLLREAGLRTETHGGDVGPFVVGETGDGPFTLIIYNHYDVQPEDPLDLWTNPPFTLSEGDGRLYGRGAADDKGEFVSRLAGWRTFRTLRPEPLPFRLIWIVEGEEEIGSPSLDRFLKKRFPDLKADLCWWDTVRSTDQAVLSFSWASKAFLPWNWSAVPQEPTCIPVLAQSSTTRSGGSRRPSPRCATVPDGS